MKIAIIGGGWVGCHLAYKLMDKHDVVIYEKNNELFSETSHNNQNRLHYGFHYARNNKTRELCKNTFNRFLNDYNFFTLELEKNFYCVPKKESIIDFETFKKIYNDFNILETDFKLKNIDGCIKTNERWIDFSYAKRFFNEMLKDRFLKKRVNKNFLKKLLQEYDYVINATNNQIIDKTIKDSFYELTLSLLYEQKKDIGFDAVTLVDGKFFSIYPYKKNIITLTDVECTPLKKFDTMTELKKYEKTVDNRLIHDKKRLFEKKVLHYYENFLNDFKYYGYLLSVKSKFDDKSDGRYPVITQKENLINCFTGKIQGIYIIEDYINDIINKNS